MQDPCEIAAKDALLMFDLYSVDDAPCQEALQAVIDAKAPARLLLLEVALSRLEFQAAIAPDKRRAACFVHAINYVEDGLELCRTAAPEDSGLKDGTG